MISKKPYSIVQLLALLFCAWQAKDIYYSWSDTPFLRGGLLTFVIWIIPAATYWMMPRHQKDDVRPWSFELMCAAVVISVIGMIGSVNVVKHVALALAVWSLTPIHWGTVPWLVTCLAWMPAAAYFLKGFQLNHVIAGRVILAVSGAVWGVVYLYFLEDRNDER